MSAPVEETAPAVEQTAPATGAQSETQPSELGDAGKKAIDRMKAERDEAIRKLRDVEPKAKAHDEYVEAQKSEQQKIADRAAAAELERDEARAEAIRYRVAAAHGITDEQDFSMLGTGTEEEITAKAQWIAQKNAAASATNRPVPPNGRPVESLRPGASPAETTLPDDSYPAHWFPKGNDSKTGA